MTLLIMTLIFVAIIGLCIGSFLNVVILRALTGESIVLPASKCPKCQTPLKWWHNIPVISYIFLRGKCAFCKEPISIQYPIIELITGLLFTVLFLKFGYTIDTIYSWIAASVLIVIAGTDIKEKVVFNVHTYILIGLGIVYTSIATIITFIQLNKGYHIPNITFWSNPLVNGLEGLVLGILIMEVLARTGYLFVKERAFGEGDTYIAAGLGMIFGWQNLIILLVYSVIIQITLFLPIFIRELAKQKKWTTLISFVLFVVFAILICILQNINLFKNENIYIMCIILLALLGAFTCHHILKGLRENPAERTFLPFGPALVAAAFIMMII